MHFSGFILPTLRAKLGHVRQTLRRQGARTGEHGGSGRNLRLRGDDCLRALPPRGGRGALAGGWFHAHQHIAGLPVWAGLSITLVLFSGRSWAQTDAAFKKAVAVSQQEAIECFPDLKVPATPINKRFVAEYDRLQKAHDPLLNNPEWPLELAMGCANTLHIKSSYDESKPHPSTAPVSEQKESVLGGTLDDCIAKYGRGVRETADPQALCQVAYSFVKGGFTIQVQFLADRVAAVCYSSPVPLEDSELKGLLQNNRQGAGWDFSGTDSVNGDPSHLLDKYEAYVRTDLGAYANYAEIGKIHQLFIETAAMKKAATGRTGKVDGL